VRTPGEEERDRMFYLNYDFLSHKAYRAVSVLNMSPSEVAVVVINVDDEAWTELANILTPGKDWQKYRDRGEIPISRGSVTWETVELVCSVVPGIDKVLKMKPSDGHLYALVLAAGGASVYEVPFDGNWIS